MLKKILKIFGYIVTTVFVLIVIGITAVFTLLNPNDFKDKIAKFISEKAHREFTIDGSIGITFYPILGLKIENAKFSDIKIGEADISVKIIPLLSKQIIVDKLYLKNSQIKFVTNPDGTNNLQDLTELFKSAKPKSPETDSAAKPSTPITIKIEAVEILDSNFFWHDLKNNKQYNFSKLSLKTENLSAEATAIPFALSFSYDNNLLSTSAVLKIDREKRLLQFEPLSLTAALKIPTTQYPINATIKTKVQVDLNNETIKCSDAEFTFANLNAAGNFEIDQFLKSPSVAGEFASSSFNPDEFMRALGFTVSNNAGDMFKNAKITTKLQASANSINFTAIDTQIDDMSAQGKINFDLSDKPNKSNFDFKLDRLDVNRYGELRFKRIKHPSASTAASSGPILAANNLPVNKLKQSMQYVGTLTIGLVDFGKMHASDARFNVIYADEAMYLESINAKLYRGTMSGNAKIDSSGAKQKIAADLSLINIDVQKLFHDIAKTDDLSGAAQLKINFTAEGRIGDEIMRNLNGSGNFDVANGILRGVDIPHQIDIANSLLTHNQKPLATKLPQTEFGKFAGTFKVVNGILKNDDLMIKSDRFLVIGGGIVNLINQTFDYNLNVSGIEKKRAAGGVKIEKPSDFVFPATVTGPFSKPVISPDMGKLTIRIISSSLGKKIESLINGQVGKDLHIDSEAAGKFVQSLGLEKLFGK